MTGGIVHRIETLLVTLTCALLTSTAAEAQPAEREPGPLITNVQGRTITRLDGRWQTIVDPFENGYYN